jgi:hypothetical protein
VIPAAPSDVLAVYGGPSSWGQRLIRIGGILAGHTGVANHVQIVTHQDQAGRWIGIEGRPGGVGLCDCTPSLNSDLTRSNHDQPRPGGDKAMTQFLAGAAKSLGIQYDWVGIAMDTAQAAGVPDLAKAIDPLWRWTSPQQQASGILPGHVVCSSLAAMLYTRAGWAEPTGKQDDRTCTPPQWWDWSDQKQWENT